MRTLVWALGAAMGIAAPAAAQEPLPPPRGYITVVEPHAWTGEGVILRGIGRPIRVRGTAFHPSGITRVAINGTDAEVVPAANGAIRFTATVGAEAAARDVQIVAYPAQGDPIVRVQKPNGTWAYGASTPPAPVLPAATGFGAETTLRVSLAALSPASQRAIVDALRREPRIAVQPGGGTHLAVRRDGGDYLVTGVDGAVRHRVRATSEAEVNPLIAVLVQEYGALQLAELPAPPAGFALDFAFVSGSEFRLGQAIEFRVRPARRGYLTVVDLGTDGVMGVLYPTPADEAEVQAGTEVRLPTQGARRLYAPQPPYMAAEPTGTGVVRAFVTPRPMQLPGAADGPISADALLRALREATSSNEPWATATLTYHIVP